MANEVSGNLVSEEAKTMEGGMMSKKELEPISEVKEEDGSKKSEDQRKESAPHETQNNKVSEVMASREENNLEKVDESGGHLDDTG